MGSCFVCKGQLDDNEAVTTPLVANKQQQDAWGWGFKG